MEEGQVSVDGVSRQLPAPFLVAATQNPVEYEGTYPLPEAQLDRFLLKVVLPIPDRAPASWRSCAGTRPGFDPRDVAAAGVTAVAGPADIAAGQAAVKTGPGHPRGRRLHRRHRPRHPRVAVAQPRRQPARRHRAAALRPRLGLADRPGLRHPRRRQGARPRDPRPPARAAARGRARGRRRGRGARLRARLGPGPPLTGRHRMVISGRVPLLLLLGLRAGRAAPGHGTVWLWLLVVAVLAGWSTCCSPRARVADRRPATRSARSGSATPPSPCWSSTNPAAAGSARSCATPGSPRPARPATGTGSPSRRGPGASCAPRCARAAAATCRRSA